ncbi:Ribonuclease P/MRP protein subunit POP5 [Yarrowia sp. B02]|nr:Ribonuclease P/MRP protein subunit POP5 [Yarrowia sp. B02]
MVRLKSRYLLFQVVYPSDTLSPSEDAKARFLKIHRTSDASVFNARNLTQIFRDEMEDLHGHLGAGSIMTTLNVKYFSPVTSTGIVRVGRQFLREFWAALTNITSIDNSPVVINVVHVSATIKKCEMAAIERNQQIVRYLQKGGMAVKEEQVDMSDEE